MKDIVVISTVLLQKGRIQKIVFEITFLFDDEVTKTSIVRLIFYHNYLSLVNEFSETREKWFCELRTDFLQFCFYLSGFYLLSLTSIFVDSFEEKSCKIAILSLYNHTLINIDFNNLHNYKTHEKLVFNDYI